MTKAFRPGSLDEAVRVLADPDLGAVPVAGCTDILVVDVATGRRHAAVVDVHRLPELRGIRHDAGLIDVGAGTTFSELRADANVCRLLPILAEAAATVGGWQIQNRATIGGNIANASPAGDSLPVLLALSAELVLAGPAGERVVAYENMHLGYRKTDLRAGELIVRVRIPVPDPRTVQSYKKVGTRAAQAISKVVVAFAARNEGGRLSAVRLAAGSVAPVPVRLFDAERACEGARPDVATADLAAAAAQGAVQPLTDVRSTASYRRWVLGRVVRRMVLDVRGESTTLDSTP